jgi:gliding motility-associated lipoprotein GldD
MLHSTDKMKNLLKNKDQVSRRRAQWGSLAFLAILVILAIIRLTHSNVYAPKPYGHPYIPLPVHTYTPLTGDFPYSFEISTHAVVEPDTSSIAEPYWINIHYPSFQADIQITYKPVKNNKKLLHTYLEDSYKLSMKHQIRASAINNQVIQTPHGINVTLVTLEGQVPTSFQFYTTNSNEHFLRGALYFPTALENDYLAPIIDFMKADMLHMLNTLQWKKPANAKK